MSCCVVVVIIITSPIYGIPGAERQQSTRVNRSWLALPRAVINVLGLGGSQHRTFVLLFPTRHLILRPLRTPVRRRRDEWSGTGWAIMRSIVTHLLRDKKFSKF